MTSSQCSEKHKTLTTVGDVVPVGRIELVLASDDLREEICIVLIVEGRISAEENVGDYTDRPHIDCFSIWSLLENFGR